MTVYFTSDTHFGHANIISLTNRPFKTVEEMDDYIITEWNKKIKRGDIVYHLGDFTLGNLDQFKKYVMQLNGDIRILGNFTHHDNRWLPSLSNGRPDFRIMDIKSKSGDVVEILPPIWAVKADKEIAILCHFPLKEWQGYYHNAWHFHGHTHGTINHGESRIIDISMDCTDFVPLTFTEVLELHSQRLVNKSP